MGTAIGLASVDGYADTPDIGCGDVSPADALYMYKGQLAKAKTAAFTALTRCTVARLRDYETAFRELYSIVKELEHNLGEQDSARLGTLAGLVEIGALQAGILHPTARAGGDVADVQALSLVANRVSRAAEYVAATGETITLSPAATRVLRKLIARVNDPVFQELARAAEESNSDHSHVLERMQVAFDEVEGEIDQARTSLVAMRMQRSPGAAQDVSVARCSAILALRRAVASLAKAITTLGDFIAERCASVNIASYTRFPRDVLEAMQKALVSEDCAKSADVLTESAVSNLFASDGTLTPIDLVLLMIDGTRRAIELESKDGLSSRRHEESLGVRLVSYHPSRGKTIQSLLDQYCPEGTIWRASWLGTRIYCNGGWSRALELETRVKIIKNILPDFDCKRCNAAQCDDFARELA